MTEDEIYRSSTQYRLWSFTEEGLVSQRATTNTLAASRVRAAIQRLRSNDENASDKQPKGIQAQTALEEIDCLSVEEELQLVRFYCFKAMQLSDFCEFPTNVKSTAVQFLKRFYLSNSPMTYHPKQIMPSALFLATKTENHYISLKSFASKLKNTAGDDVVAPEVLLTQGLRFTFDVRHPHRGSEGGFMEILAIASGSYQSQMDSKNTSQELQQRMFRLEPLKEGKATMVNAEDLKARTRVAHGKVKDILKTSALLTDVYFLYTPSQIWLSALMLADEPMAVFYIESKLSNIHGVVPKVTEVLRKCAQRLSLSVSVSPGSSEIDELTRIDKKLYKCRNPEKLDLVGISKAQKRDGVNTDGAGLDERIVKKRKLEREKGIRDGEQVFGPPITA